MEFSIFLLKLTFCFLNALAQGFQYVEISNCPASTVINRQVCSNAIFVLGRYYSNPIFKIKKMNLFLMFYSFRNICSKRKYTW